ncbi:hypothetical protein HK096_011387 [Nowakowskiella sp. JEL0078]|nr:hypothetical protein HK096_011387 [Nowakowskiella sp. JEL0078]
MSATMVDLPCIIETQKTFDNKQFFKIADISQVLSIMVLVEKIDPTGQSFPWASRKLTKTGKKQNQYAWPDGLSPPLKNCRKRRFRKRISKTAIEIVESEVLRLLKADAESEDVIWEEVETKEIETNIVEATSQIPSEDEDHSENTLPTTPYVTDELQTESIAPDEDSDDSAIGAVIDEAFNAQDSEDEEEEDEDDHENEAEPEDSGDEDQEKAQIRQECEFLSDEIILLENKLEEKTREAERQQNKIMKARFEGIVKTLAGELDLKKERLQSIKASLASRTVESSNEAITNQEIVEVEARDEEMGDIIDIDEGMEGDYEEEDMDEDMI